MEKTKNLNNNKIIVGVDGGGTKTDVWVSDLNFKILSKTCGGSSNLRNIGIEESILNILKLTEKSLSKIKQKNISAIYMGLPAFAEEYKTKETKIKNFFLKNKTNFFVPKDKIFIGSDQKVAFKSGTDKEEGIVVIAGTGSVVRGWKGKKDVKCSGWGWLTDKGGSYWIGKRAYEETIKSLDGRAKKSVLTDLIMKELKIKNINDLNEIIYKKPKIKTFSSFSFLVSRALKKKDKTARIILEEGVKELVLSTAAVIKRLQFKKEFPLILAGGMFKLDFYKNNFKKEIKKINSNALFILPNEDPVFGALKLAKEKLYDKKTKKN